MSRVRQLAYFAETMLMPGGISAFARWKPFSITSFRMLSALRHIEPKFKTIIDGGANKGQFARAATEAYPDARIIAFEPLPDVFEILKQNLKDRPKVSVVQSALGSVDGTTSFFRDRYSLASSVLPRKNKAASQQMEELEVPVRRLDTAVKDFPISTPSLLKLDLQGFELEALKGADRLLEEMSYVLLEMSFVRTYENEPDFSEVFVYMLKAGFQFVQPIDVLRGAGNGIVQMDALFRRIKS